MDRRIPPLLHINAATLTPFRRTSFDSSQSAARRNESRDATPDSAKANSAIAVSHTGEKHGWRKKRSPSLTIRASNCRTASCRTGSSSPCPKTSSAITAYIIGG